MQGVFLVITLDIGVHVLGSKLSRAESQAVETERELIVAAVVTAVSAVMWIFGAYKLMLPAAMALLFTGVFLAVGRLSYRKGAI